MWTSSTIIDSTALGSRQARRARTVPSSLAHGNSRRASEAARCAYTLQASRYCSATDCSSAPSSSRDASGVYRRSSSSPVSFLRRPVSFRRAVANCATRSTTNNTRQVSLLPTKHYRERETHLRLVVLCEFFPRIALIDERLHVIGTDRQQHLEAELNCLRRGRRGVSHEQVLDVRALSHQLQCIDANRLAGLTQPTTRRMRPQPTMGATPR